MTGVVRADGDAVFDEETHYLQCFYYPEACTPADGPTEILPGSHLWPMQTTPPAPWMRPAAALAR